MARAGRRFPILLLSPAAIAILVNDQPVQVDGKDTVVVYQGNRFRGNRVMRGTTVIRMETDWPVGKVPDWDSNSVSGCFSERGACSGGEAAAWLSCNCTGVRMLGGSMRKFVGQRRNGTCWVMRGKYQIECMDPHESRTGGLPEES